nr:hypothetical protein CFP56_70231 [Quercus suber]
MVTLAMLTTAAPLPRVEPHFPCCKVVIVLDTADGFFLCKTASPSRKQASPSRMNVDIGTSFHQIIGLITIGSLSRTIGRQTRSSRSAFSRSYLADIHKSSDFLPPATAIGIVRHDIAAMLYLRAFLAVPRIESPAANSASTAGDGGYEREIRPWRLLASLGRKSSIAVKIAVQ